MVVVLMIIKGIIKRYEKWNPVHPTYGAFWGMGIGIGISCGVGWGPGFGPEVIGYIGAGCGVGFSVGITLAGFGIGLPTNFLLATPYNKTKELRDPMKNSINENDESEIDKRLENIKSRFNGEYEIWSWKKKDSSSRHGSLSTDGNSSPKSTRGRPKANRMETRSEVPQHEIHGFTEETLFLRNFLLKRKESKELKTLAIVGKYGVGKTTLCQRVFNDKDVEKAYFPRIWVSMFSEETREENPKIDVLKRILGSLGFEDDMFKHIQKDAEEEEGSKVEAGDEETIKELLNALHLHLTGKRYLIVLDDVWEDNDWNERLNDEKNQQEKTHLSHGFPKGFGGRVIVTSRDKGLAKKIVGEEEENLMRLYPRSDPKIVWAIYKEKADSAFPDEKVDPRYPRKFKKELMDKSCGIPLVARMLAKIKPVRMDDTEEGEEERNS